MSVDYAVNLWLDRGCAKDKLVMGMGTYGRTFTLVNKAKTGLNADASGPGAAGPSTSAKGFLSYYEICDFVKNKGWTSEFIDEIKSPIAYKGKCVKEHESILLADFFSGLLREQPLRVDL